MPSWSVLVPLLHISSNFSRTLSNEMYHIHKQWIRIWRTSYVVAIHFVSTTVCGWLGVKHEVSISLCMVARLQSTGHGLIQWCRHALCKLPLVRACYAMMPMDQWLATHQLGRQWHVYNHPVHLPVSQSTGQSAGHSITESDYWSVRPQRGARHIFFNILCMSPPQHYST